VSLRAGWSAARQRHHGLGILCPGLAVAGLAIYAFCLRCLHLLNPDHYYLLSPDSYFFHWVAQGVMAGNPPPLPPGSETTYLLHSGLAYPLAYTAEAIASVFNIPSADALDIVCKLTPPLLGAVTVIVIYLSASKICDRRVGLFAAFAWGALLSAVLVGSAGYVDRDGLSILLITVGVLLFYLSKGWHFHVGKRDVGWLTAGVSVLIVEALLYLEWAYMGPLLLLAALAVYVMVRFLIGYADRLQTEKAATRRLAAAATDVNWQAFAVIVAGNVILLASRSGQAASWFGSLAEMIQAEGASSVAEMQGLSVEGLLGYGFFFIPMAAGIYSAWRYRSEGSIFFSCWFLSMLALSLLAGRVVLYAAPAASLLSGVGLAFLWSKARQGKLRPLKQLAVVALLGILVLLSFAAYSVGSNSRLAPDEDWEDALAYLRESTPQESVIMSEWSWGYWILDLGQRIPVVDNGYYSRPTETLHDIGVAYTTSDPAEAVQIMEKHGASHLVFSTLDLDVTLTILGWAGLSGEYESFPEDSLVTLSLNGEFQSGGGLKVVYRSEPDSEVVVLGLAQGD
jgi:asparagine N-glycosylation enzyme membrane subunit Stt3